MLNVRGCFFFIYICCRNVHLCVNIIDYSFVYFSDMASWLFVNKYLSIY